VAETWLELGYATRVRGLVVRRGLDHRSSRGGAARFAHRVREQHAQKRAAAVREVVEQTGGLRADQFILCSEPTLVGFAYGLWWPWGDDTTISLRIGLAGRALQSEILRFRELFGALD